jgi:hypothetical protein
MNNDTFAEPRIKRSPKKPQLTLEEQALKAAGRWNESQSRRTVELTAMRVCEAGLAGLTDDESGALRQALDDLGMMPQDFARLCEDLQQVINGEASVMDADYEGLRRTARDAAKAYKAALDEAEVLRRKAVEADAKSRNASTARSQWQAAKARFQFLFKESE